MSVGEVSALVSAAFAVASAFVAAFAVYVPWRHQRENEFLQQAVLSLERAYRALSSDGQSTAPPLADRLNWLTAARHLVGYKELKQRVRTSLFRSLCEEHEEFWRHQFYLCLNVSKIQGPGYFEGSGSPVGMQPIEPRSAVVVYSFAAWPKDKLDRLDSVNIGALLAESNPLQGNPGLRAYLEKFPKLVGET